MATVRANGPSASVLPHAIPCIYILLLYVCIHVCMHKYMHVDIYVYTVFLLYIYVCLHVHVYVCVYIYTHNNLPHFTTVKPHGLGTFQQADCQARPLLWKALALKSLKKATGKSTGNHAGSFEVTV